MNTERLINEVKYSTARSSGSGGQHVNKTETKVELFFDVEGSAVLTDRQKERLKNVLANRISKEGVFHISSQEKRSQVWNKQIVTKRFINIIQHALTPQKKRIPTKPSKSMVEKRLKAKRQTAEVKEMRKRVNLMDN